VTHGQADYDVIVVGAGIGGIYAVRRFTQPPETRRPEVMKASC